MTNFVAADPTRLRARPCAEVIYVAQVNSAMLLLYDNY
jgi:hypothetical protein